MERDLIAEAFKKYNTRAGSKYIYSLPKVSNWLKSQGLNVDRHKLSKIFKERYGKSAVRSNNISYAPSYKASRIEDPDLKICEALLQGVEGQSGVVEDLSGSHIQRLSAANFMLSDLYECVVRTICEDTGLEVMDIFPEGVTRETIQELSEKYQQEAEFWLD